SITVTSSNGCTDIRSATIAQPNPLLPNKTVTQISCHGFGNGSIALNPTGGTPGYTYSWSNGATTSVISNLTVNSYQFTVTDSRGCTSSTLPPTQITEPAALSASASATSHVICNGVSN